MTLRVKKTSCIPTGIPYPMLMQKKTSSLCLGAHLSVAGGLHNALLEARRLKMACVQLFVANQRQWQIPPLDADIAETFHEIRRQTGIAPVVAHSKYLINLAAVDKDTLQKSLKALKDEYQRCNDLGIEFLVLHPGAHKGAGIDKGLKKVITGINRIFSESNRPICRILLETTAGSGTSLGSRFEELAQLLAMAERPELLGVCLDTCHIFAAGYDIRTPETYDKTIQDFSSIIGLDQLKIMHVNDSKTSFSSGVDRHEHIGKGELGKQAFENILHDLRLNRLPMILETPKGKSPGGRNYDKLNMAALGRLAKT